MFPAALGSQRRGGQPHLSDEEAKLGPQGRKETQSWPSSQVLVQTLPIRTWEPPVLLASPLGPMVATLISAREFCVLPGHWAGLALQEVARTPGALPLSAELPKVEACWGVGVRWPEPWGSQAAERGLGWGSFAFQGAHQPPAPVNQAGLGVLTLALGTSWVPRPLRS